MNFRKMLVVKELVFVGLLASICVMEQMGLDFLDGMATVILSVALVLLAIAIPVGIYFRNLVLARGVFYVGLTLVLIFVLGSEAIGIKGNYWIGAGLVMLVVALPVGVYFCRPDVRESLALIYTLRAGNRAVVRGDFSQAEKAYCKAVAQAEDMTANRDWSLGTALCQLADVYRLQGRLADAEPIYKQALKHYEQPSAMKPAQRAAATATALNNLGAVYINQGRYSEAEPLCREAIAVFENESGPRHDFQAISLLNLGLVIAGQGKYEEAERLTRQGLDLLTKQIERGELGGCIALSNLADLCRRQGRLSEAEPLARRAMALFEKCTFAREHPVWSRFLNVLAEIVRLQGRLDEAESLCRRSEALTEKAFGPEHISLDGCLATLARIRTAQGQPGEAEQLLRRCLAILEKTVVPEHPERIARMEEYATLLRTMNCPAEADQCQAKALPEISSHS